MFHLMDYLGINSFPYDTIISYFLLIQYSNEYLEWFADNSFS